MRQLGQVKNYLIHVKVFPEAIDLIPAFLHASPALVAAFTGINGRDRKRESIDKNAISLLFISKAYAVIKLLQGLSAHI